jgi:MFS family permease
MSLVSSGATAISPLGLLIAGPFSDWLGIRVWFWAGGILCVLIAVAAFFRPVIMNVESHNGMPEVPLSEPA